MENTTNSTPLPPKASGLLGSNAFRAFIGLFLTVVLVLLTGWGHPSVNDNTASTPAHPHSTEYAKSLKRSKFSLHPILEAHPQHWQAYMDWWQKTFHNISSSAASYPSLDANVTSIYTGIFDSEDGKQKGIGGKANSTYLRTEKGNAANSAKKARPAKSLKKLKEGNYLYPHEHKPIPPGELLKSATNCKNQTLCFPPVLQLTHTYNVYYCKHLHYGVRFYFLVREGLLLHPRLNLVDKIDKADFIVYLPESAQWDKSECNNPAHYHKLVVLDESDYPDAFQSDKAEQFFLIFKRSFVRRHDGHFKGYMPYLNNMQILPLTYPVAEAYLHPVFKPTAARSLEIVCSLRGGKADPTRQRVKEFIQEYARTRNITAKVIAGEINHASRTVISKQYFTQMYDSKIVVTSNPSNWEGDFRFGEALGSGAAIFVDHMYVPRPYPYKEQVHVMYYDSHDKDELFDKLDRLRNDPKLMQQVAIQGYVHALTYHRAICMLDYIFRTVHIKQLALKHNIYADLNSNINVITSGGGGGVLPPYTDHGYMMRYLALQKQVKYTKHVREQRQIHENGEKPVGEGNKIHFQA
eukprot:gene28096-33928_t